MDGDDKLNVKGLPEDYARKAEDRPAAADEFAHTHAPALTAQSGDVLLPLRVRPAKKHYPTPTGIIHQPPTLKLLARRPEDNLTDVNVPRLLKYPHHRACDVIRFHHRIGPFRP